MSSGASSDEPDVTAVTTSGDPIVLFTSRQHFGFHAGDVVHFTKSRRNGERAVIRGVCENGMLWFSVLPPRKDGEADARAVEELPVQTTSCRGREEYIRQYGWVVDSE